MKRQFYTYMFGLLVTGALASCMDDYSSATEGNGQLSQIELNCSLEQYSQTRVNDGGFIDGDRIGVYIVNYRDGNPSEISSQSHVANEMFTLNEATGAWKPQTPVYWTDNETPADVYSYYPYKEEISDPKKVDFQIYPRQDSNDPEKHFSYYEYSDLLWANNAGVTPGTSISLGFSHIMSGIQINLLPGYGIDQTAWPELSKSVLVKNVPSAVSLDLSTGNLSPVSDERISVVPYCDGESYRAVVMPTVVKSGTALFDITVDGYSYRFVKDSDMELMRGKLHRFTIEVVQKVPEGDYEFNIIDEAVTAWEDDGISHGGDVRDYVIIDSPQKGNLWSVLQNSGYDLALLKNLKIKGEMNSDDFSFLRTNLPSLEAINLKDVKVKDAHYLNSGGGEPEDDIIPSKAFYCCKTLRYIVFPEDIKKVGEYAFRASGLVGNLEIPEGVTHIGLSAFDNWAEYEGAYMYLTSLTLPTTLEYIGIDAFRNNKFNCQLVIPESVKEIGDRAFAECYYLNGQLTLPSGLQTLGDGAINLPGFTGPLVIPKGVKIIKGLSGGGFSTVVLNEGLEEIGDYGLGGSHLSKVNYQGDLSVPSTVHTLGREAFCKTQFSHIYLPEGLTEIPVGAFCGCDKLIDTLKIPSTVKQIRAGAFEGCTSLTAIVLPEGLESIGGDNMGSWMSSTFGGCNSLNLLRCNAKEPPVIIGDVFGSLPKNNFTIEVPEGSVEKYRAAEGWKEFKRISVQSNLVCRPQFANLLNKGAVREAVLNADDNWSIKYSPSWCSVSPSSGYKKTQISITIDDLADGAGSRQDSIVFQIDRTEQTTCYYIKQYDSEYKEDESYTLQEAGRGNGINLIVVGDGYDAGDIASGTYLDAMTQTMEYFFGVEPFKTYRDYFNVYTAFAMSYESGIGTINTLRDTKFNTQYGNYTASSRISCDHMYAMQYVSDNIEVDGGKFGEATVILVPHSDQYDGVTYMYGDGTALAVCPHSTFEFPNDARGLVQHEAAGHGFGKFADEYVYHKAWIQTCKCQCCEHKEGLLSMQNSGWGQNLSLKGNYQEVPWLHLIQDRKYSDIVDIYEGGYFHSNGVYRSEYNSVMNNNVPYISTWCRELIVRRIKKLAGETFSYEDFVANDSREWGEDFTLYSRGNEFASSKNALQGASPVIIKSSSNLDK